MGIQLRKPLFCLFQYLPERNIWFIHCLLGGKLSPKVTDEGAIDLPNGAGEKFRWGDWREPLRLSTRKGWVRNRPLIRPSVRTGAPSPQGEGFGGMSLIWKPSFPEMLFSIFSLENASQIGLSIPEEIASRTYQRQRSPKRASDSKRAIKPGVQGLAPGVLSPDFLQRKSGSPAGVGGEPTSQGPPCNGSNGATYR